MTTETVTFPGARAPDRQRTVVSHGVRIAVYEWGDPDALPLALAHGGFDFARTFNPSRSLGAANGVVNVGGFLASFTMMFAIGLILDALAGPGADSASLYSLESFRLAWCVQYVVVGLGVLGLISARRRTRRRLAEDEGITVAPLWVALSDRLRRGRSGRPADGQLRLPDR